MHARMMMNMTKTWKIHKKRKQFQLGDQTTSWFIFPAFHPGRLGEAKKAYFIFISRKILKENCQNDPFWAIRCQVPKSQKSKKIGIGYVAEQIEVPY